MCVVIMGTAMIATTTALVAPVLGVLTPTPASATTAPVAGQVTSKDPFSVAVDVRPPQPRFTSIVVKTTNTLGLAP